MKRYIITIFFAFTLSSAFSQEIDFGVKVGFNTTDFRDFQGKNRTGFIAGLFAKFKLNDKLSIQPEILYSQEGANLDFAKVDLNYIDIPVILKFYFIGDLHAQIGPKFGFMIGKNSPSEITVNNVSQRLKTNSFDLGLVLGIGYDFPLGIRASIRYLYGLSNVLELEVTNEKSKISMWQFSLGYSFL